MVEDIIGCMIPLCLKLIVGHVVDFFEVGLIGSRGINWSVYLNPLFGKDDLAVAALRKKVNKQGGYNNNNFRGRGHGGYSYSYGKGYGRYQG